VPDEAVVLAANTPSPDPIVMPLAGTADKPTPPARIARTDQQARPDRNQLPSSVMSQPKATIRPGHAPDPLAARLDRMESALAQAEQMALREPDQGVRYAASPLEAGPSAHGRDGQERSPGVSGAWAIRHPVMQLLPDTFGPLPMAASDVIPPAA
jgi:hypothetical protein